MMLQIVWTSDVGISRLLNNINSTEKTDLDTCTAETDSDSDYSVSRLESDNDSSDCEEIINC